MMITNENIEDFIIRSLRGECSAEELACLQEWVNASDLNRRTYDEIKGIVEIAPYLQGRERLNKSRALQRVMGQVKQPSRYRIRLLKYAAIFILPLVFGGIAYYWMLREKTPEMSLVAIDKTIQPGGPKAMLYLSDGQIVDLLAVGDSVITDGHGGQEIMLSGKASTLNYAQASGKEGLKKEIVYNRIVVPRGGEYMLILSDGTKVWLNSETELEYPLAFGLGSREVRLKGEAYFEVTKDVKRLFHVVMGEATIEVTGTAFNASCYPEEKACRAVLESGKINLLANHMIKHVAVGECASYDKASRQIQVEPVDLKYFTAWRHGTFYFYDTPLSEIVQKLGRWYDVKFSFANNALRDICFSGAALRSKPIDVILQLLESTQSLKFEIQKDGTILVNKK